jgi:hypothetical protein
LSFNFTPCSHVSIFRSCYFLAPPFLFHEHGSWYFMFCWPCIIVT